jgi:hypothetical protein
MTKDGARWGTVERRGIDRMALPSFDVHGGAIPAAFSRSPSTRLADTLSPSPNRSTPPSPVLISRPRRVPTFLDLDLNVGPKWLSLAATCPCSRLIHSANP